VDAFERLYRAYVDRVHALCWRLCGDRHRAEDLTQEVFLRVWERIDAFEGRSQFFTWVYRMAVNRVTDSMRSEMQRTQREVSDEMVQVPDRATSGESPLAALDLEAAIAALPTGARVTFVLHDVEGYTHEEIATMTGIAVGTSKAQLHRARRLLQEKLER
jgi:RNA polymerase sigma-70 factor (ECF subfamily)